MLSRSNSDIPNIIKDNNNNTISIWGKLCIIFFYSYIWISIVMYANGLFHPRDGMDCPYQNLSEYVLQMLDFAQRCVYLLLIGVLLSANHGGIKVWNVTMLCVFMVLLGMLIFQHAYTFGIYDGTPTDDDYCSTTINELKKATWIFYIFWPIVSWICSVLESKASGRRHQGSSEEVQRLVT